MKKTREGMRHLEALLTKSEMEKICDSKVIGDATYYRLSERKSIEFLSQKIFSIAEELLESESVESSLFFRLLTCDFHF